MLYLNFLWIVFTLAGFVVGGIFPATVSLFSIMKNSVRGDERGSIFKSFWSVYKQEFLRANRLGYTLVFIAVVLYYDWLFTNVVGGTIGMVAKGILLGCVFLFGITVVYIFPVYLQAGGKVFASIKSAFLIAITYPIHTMIMFISIFSLCVVFILLPMAGYLFATSGLCWVITFFSLHLFRKIEKQAEEMQERKKRQLATNH
nr:DUF624 domain-containing protein [Bacillus sp. FJAT-50079]